MKKTIILIYLLFNTIITHAQKKSKLVLFVYEECPICVYMTSHIKEIMSEYGNKIEIEYVFPNAMSNYKTASLFCEKYNIKGGKIILDENKEYTKKYRAKVTPEAVLTYEDKIIYQGRINDGYARLGRRRGKVSQHDVKNAIEYLLNQSNPKPIQNCPEPVGCYITQ